MKEDGVYILTGNTPSDFTVRLLDNSAIINAADSAVTLNNKVYALTTQGISTISDSGVGIISRPIENKILGVTRSGFCHETAAFGLSYESDRAYFIWLPTIACDTTATQVYRYNSFNESWVRWDVNAKSGIVNPANDKIYLVSPDTNFLKQERKNFDRTDYADNEVSLSVIAQTVSCCKVELSNICCVCAGDVIVQTQFLTKAKFNRLLNKLDFDPVLGCADYYSTLNVTTGACLAASLITLQAKVCADDPCTCYSCFSSAPSTFAIIRTEFNTFISELNSSAGVGFFDYSCIGACCTTCFESVVIDTDTFNNATVAFCVPFIAGPIKVHKKINAVVEWSPIHCGDPSVQKQFPEGTLVLDGNNFYSAKFEFATDLSKDFSGFCFRGNNTGTWGGFDFGCISWNGEGSDVPHRQIIPRQKQRGRYISVKFTHVNAREDFSLLGVSVKTRPISSRSYRDIN
jgi:hypothetical protein